MKTVLVISPHADDAAAFCGGTIASLVADGARVVLVRVTTTRIGPVTTSGSRGTGTALAIGIATSAMSATSWPTPRTHGATTTCTLATTG